jgi:predicted dehydrogenase
VPDPSLIKRVSSGRGETSPIHRRPEQGVHDVLTFGVLGCAEIARRRVLPAMAAHPHPTLVGGASRNLATATETATPYGCRPVSGYANLLADDTVDAVYIPLPAALHAEWVEAALRAGKHVLAEKPLAADPDRTRALFALARARGLALMENVMFVHHGQHAAVRRLAAGIGPLRGLDACFTIPPPPATDIRFRADLGGGSLGDVGVYPIRAALQLLRGELRVVGATTFRSPGHDVDTAGAALLRDEAGVTAHLTFGMDHPYRSRYELTGTRGRILVERAFTPPADHEPRVLVESAEGSRTVTLPADDQVANTLSAFVAAVAASGRPAGPAPGEAESLAQAELIAAIREAAARG